MVKFFTGLTFYRQDDEVLERIRREFPNQPSKEIKKILSKRWKDLSKKDKDPFTKKAQEAKRENEAFTDDLEYDEIPKKYIPKHNINYLNYLSINTKENTDNIETDKLTEFYSDKWNKMSLIEREIWNPQNTNKIVSKDKKTSQKVKPNQINEEGKVKPNQINEEGKVKPSQITEVEEVKPNQITEVEEVKPSQITEVEEVKPNQITEEEEVKLEDMKNKLLKMQIDIDELRKII
jgi:hypothetical protein